LEALDFSSANKSRLFTPRGDFRGDELDDDDDDDVTDDDDDVEFWRIELAARLKFGGDLKGEVGWQEVRSGLEMAEEEEEEEEAENTDLDETEKRDRGVAEGESTFLPQGD